MSDEIVEILEAAGHRATLTQSPYVDAGHVEASQFEVLADDALAFLRSRAGRPIASNGWIRVAASQAGLMPYWVNRIGWTEQERKRFRPLRKDVYDRLEERGDIVKPPGQGAAIDVSPLEGGG